MEQTPSSKQKMTKRTWFTLFLLALLTPATILLCARIPGRKYYIASVLIIIYTILPFFLVFEQKRPQARELVILAVLCALTVASRAAFSVVPYFKPMLGLIMIAGIAQGAEAGFLTGAISAFASNFIFGQGPWTPWQMLAYGVAGFLAGLLTWSRLLPKKPLPLAIFGFLSVMLIVGPLLDTCTVFTMSSMIKPSTIGAVYLSGLPVNLTQAAATALTLFAFAKPMLGILERIQIKYGLPQN